MEIQEESMENTGTMVEAMLPDEEELASVKDASSEEENVEKRHYEGNTKERAKSISKAVNFVRIAYKGKPVKGTEFSSILKRMKCPYHKTIVPFLEKKGFLRKEKSGRDMEYRFVDYDSAILYSEFMADFTGFACGKITMEQLVCGSPRVLGKEESIARRISVRKDRLYYLQKMMSMYEKDESVMLRMFLSDIADKESIRYILVHYSEMNDGINALYEDLKKETV